MKDLTRKNTTAIVLTPDEKAHCTRMGISEAAFLATKRIEAGLHPLEDANGLSGEERAHCARLGVSEENYLLAKAEEPGGRR